jgi:hypothetical protein
LERFIFPGGQRNADQKNHENEQDRSTPISTIPTNHEHTAFVHPLRPTSAEPVRCRTIVSNRYQIEDGGVIVAIAFFPGQEPSAQACP